jgi:hypothetical protein
MTTTKPIWISDVREREIANLAEHEAQRTFSRGRVEPELIAEQEGISFCYASCAEQLDGALVHAGGKFIIFANERRARRGSPRNRFTFAHELGHYFHNDHRRAVIAGKFGARFPRPEFAWDPTFEKEADVFAANLLMPASSFKRSTGKCWMDSRPFAIWRGLTECHAWPRPIARSSWIGFPRHARSFSGTGSAIRWAEKCRRSRFT